MANTIKTQTIFGDLKHYLTQLKKSKNSPAETRRCFSGFINNSQKLTAFMRREYSDIKKAKFEASEFSGWNKATNLIKRIRNQDEHELPIFVVVHQVNYIKMPNTNSIISFAGTWSLGDQHESEFKNELKCYLPDPETGKISDIEIIPEKIEFEYRVHTEDKKVKDMIDEVGIYDIFELCDTCFEVYEQYYDWYNKKIT